MAWRGSGWAVPADGTTRCAVMGILNVTPDSFSDGGRHADADAALKRALQMVDEGAEVIDVGGESTRPGAQAVPLDEELKRVIPVVEGIVAATDIPVCVDTMKADVADAALGAGAHIINDVTAGRASDGAVFHLVADAGAGLVLMHMQGGPRTMQTSPTYHDVVQEVTVHLRERAAAAQAAGVGAHAICLDPGLGFGKTPDHNIALLRATATFKALGHAVLIGHSRKSLIGDLTGRPVHERLAGSLAIAAYAVERGADVLRVHDVAETVDVVRTIHRLRDPEAP